MAFLPWRTWVALDPLAAAQLNQDIRDNLNALFPNEEASVDWSPTLRATSSNPSTSATSGQRYRLGALEVLYVRWVLSTAGSGQYFFEPPNEFVGVASGQLCGMAFLEDSTASSNNSFAAALFNNATPDQIVFNGVGGAVSNTHPFPFASGDRITVLAIVPYV